MTHDVSSSKLTSSKENSCTGANVWEEAEGLPEAEEEVSEIFPLLRSERNDSAQDFTFFCRLLLFVSGEERGLSCKSEFESCGFGSNEAKKGVLRHGGVGASSDNSSTSSFGDLGALEGDVSLSEAG